MNIMAVFANTKLWQAIKGVFKKDDPEKFKHQVERMQFPGVIPSRPQQDLGVNVPAWLYKDDAPDA